MTVFPFPPEAIACGAPFSVIGFDWERGTAEGELLVLPAGGEAPANFPGPVYAAAPAPDRPGLLCPEDTARDGRPIAVPAFFPQGTLRERLRSAVARYGARLWLYFTPGAHLFTLPCPGSRGAALDAEVCRALCAAHPPRFCPEFVCQCSHWAEDGAVQVLLFDTPDTLAQQLTLAAACGVAYAFGELPSETVSGAGRNQSM